jgi:putative sugar O-methyltransferase
MEYFMYPVIKDDYSLFRAMIDDLVHQSSNLYRPGPYWDQKVKNTISEIEKCGIKDFRGSSSLVGLSYADNLTVDIRNSYNYGLKKIVRLATKLYPFNVLYDSQVELTRNYAVESIRKSQEILNKNSRVKELLEKYEVPYSLLGGCLQAVNINGCDYSIHYLNLLEQHDNIAAHIPFNTARTVFEIGGGFGVNIHLLIENYPNIRKVIYLDIPPNLYVGTQYLKAFYGEAVYDYSKLKDEGGISFSDTDNLEILCIAPWQIEKLEAQVHIFINAHSFVEMPKSVVSNYAQHVMRLLSLEKSAIALVSYDGFDLTTTFNPDDLPEFFSGKIFEHFEHDGLLDSSRRNLYYVSVENIPTGENDTK